ncbi:MAG: protein kinase [Paludibaculum sp.]
MNARARKPGPDQERLRQIEAVYHDARDRAGSERALFLMETCRDDQDLIREVTSLLALDDSENLFDKPVLELAAPLLDEAAETEWNPGHRAGPYEIVERIGAGGMGEVFKARDTRLDRMVALKAVHTGFSGHSALEARAIAALNHPNICTLYDVGPDYLVLELLEGETLAARLKRGPLSFEEVTSYGGQIADALWCAHSKGITHGDLKPNNLMLTKAGIKVLDFGLARFAASEREVAADAARPVFGTPGYLSPEQLSNQGSDSRTDLYALGLVLFEMSTGRRPFRGENRTELSEAILKTEAPVETLTPPEFAHIVARCLAKAPENRWQSARDVQLELEYVAALKPKVAKGNKGSRWWAVAALALLGVAAPVIYFRNTGPDVSITPFTSYAGTERSPSFSPDGNQIAFSWNGPREDNRDIYIKQVGPGDPVRLTTDPADDHSPRWSPDGKWIAFLRQQHGWTASVYLIPALGGPERKLEGAAVSGFLRGGLDWAPDGQWLLVSTVPPDGHASCLTLISVETGEVRRLTSPTAPQSDSEARFAPDGSALSFLREGEGLMILPLSPGWVAREQPRRLIVDVPGPIRSIAWSSDSQDLILSAGFEERSYLWRVSTGLNPVAKRLPFGESATDAEVARRGERLAFSRYDRELNIWSLALEEDGGASRPPEKVFDSTQSELSPDFSPDGSKVAFGSGRSGNDEIWTCQSNGANCAQLTTLNGPHAGSPVWSPDGNWIAFDASYPKNWEIRVIRSSGGKPIRIAAGMMPRWSRDGKWIYYVCSLGGRTCRVPSMGGEPVEIAKGAFARESPDGKSLYYAVRPAGGGALELRRKSLTAGQEREESLPVALGRDMAITTAGIWYVSPGAAQESVISFYEFSTGTSRAVYQGAHPIHSGLAVSPDGRRLLFTQVDRSPNLDLMLAEHFR